jgi:hypothetical protein
MPNYRPPLRGIRLSDALAEAAASAPVSRTILACYEFAHPLRVLRVVNNTEDVTVTHEAGAALNPSGSATYWAAPLTVGVPEESPAAGSPEVVITLSNVSGQVKQMLDEVRAEPEALESWTVTERLYASDDLTAPARMPPMRLTVLGVEISGQIATIRCGYGDPARRSVPRATFRSSQYPGLVAR